MNNMRSVATFFVIMLSFIGSESYGSTHCTVRDETGAEVLNFDVPVISGKSSSNAFEKKLSDTQIDAYSKFREAAHDACAITPRSAFRWGMSKVGLASPYDCEEAKTIYDAAADDFKGETLDLVVNAIQLANLNGTSAGLLVTPSDVTQVSVSAEKDNFIFKLPCEFSVRPGVTKSCWIHGEGLPTLNLRCVGNH